MKAVIFCGPTLRRKEHAAYADFEFLPPVRQGEFYAAARKGPSAIGVIDGYFDGEPAVWHKEILWALANGIAVFGASSMGALRAAELHMFGMRGIGRIFEAYRDGLLTDDGDVALIHGPVETGYLPLSEPMVNIRATLERALLEGVLDNVAADAVAAEARAMFYQERTWTSVVAAARRSVGAGLDRFAAWLPERKVDQKRDDALLLLDAVNMFLSEGGGAGPANFRFEWTETWANAPWLKADDNGGPPAGHEAILDELRLDGAYKRVKREALLRMLAVDEIASTAADPDRSDLAREAMAFRLPRGLIRQSDVHRWSTENDIDASHFERMMAGRASVEKLAYSQDVRLRSLMLDVAREENVYATLRNRARAKMQSHAGSETRIAPPLLVSWYFGKRLEAPAPEDLADYAASIGLASLDEFYKLLAAEYAFVVNHTEASGSGDD